jgi:hypothetical protein
MLERSRCCHASYIPPINVSHCSRVVGWRHATRTPLKPAAVATTAVPSSHRAKTAEYEPHPRIVPPLSVRHPKARAIAANGPKRAGTSSTSSRTSHASWPSASKTPQASRSRGTGGYRLSQAHADTARTTATTPKQRTLLTLARPGRRARRMLERSGKLKLTYYQHVPFRGVPWRSPAGTSIRSRQHRPAAAFSLE